MAELPKRYDPNAVEPKWYQRWLENRDFVANPEAREASVFDRDAAAEHHGHAHARPCFEQHDPGHSRTPRADAGFEVLLVAGNGSLRESERRPL